MSGCALCGGPCGRRHHLTGRDDEDRYLDPEFTIPVCHDDHELVHDDWRTLEVLEVHGRLTFVDRVELRLRRAAVFAARLAAARPEQGIWRSVATALARWADELARARRRFDERDPLWRADPGFYPEGG